MKIGYEESKEKYEYYGVNVEEAIMKLKSIQISIHCWQGDDVSGFEKQKVALSGGILATGSYPGKATTPEQLRQDFEFALSLIGGSHRINLHAIYAESDGPIERDAIEPKHFDNWISWAKKIGVGIDFNPTFFSHPLSESLTLSNPNKSVREFWIRHGIACREIAAYIGEKMGTPCLNNLWIPDGFKNTPANRKGPRELLMD